MKIILNDGVLQYVLMSQCCMLPKNAQSFKVGCKGFDRFNIFCGHLLISQYVVVEETKVVSSTVDMIDNIIWFVIVQIVLLITVLLMSKCQVE